MPNADPTPRHAQLPGLGQVCRLGLATRGNTSLEPDDVRAAVDRGVNYLNWCGHADGMSAAVRALGDRRGEVIVATQLYARTGDAVRRELDAALVELGTDYLDVVTYFYLETDDEWQQATAADGAHRALREAQTAGRVRAIGVTSHQRPLAARIAESGVVDLLMIRYNAAHRGAESEIFPVADAGRLPLVVYTGVRWGALLKPTPDDPPGFVPPTAAECYRFQLDEPAVSVALMAPDGRAQLEQNLALLDDWRPLSPARKAELRDHGDRVRRHAGQFP